MARILALVWEHAHCTVLAANQKGKTTEVEKAAVWPIPEELSSGSAESLGGQLREFLKAERIAPAPVVMCFPRERFTMKELRFPQLAPSEEVALVRFQVAKDLTEGMEDFALDYVTLENDADGQRRVLAVVLKKRLLASVNHFCRVAGLKLQALTARPFAMAGCLQHARAREGLAGTTADEAVLLLGTRWAELTVLRGASVVFSRSLGVNAQLPGELRRTLTMLGVQRSIRPAQLYITGATADHRPLVEGLANLDMPVTPLDVLSEEEAVWVPPEHRFALAAGLGLIEAWASKQLPINLAHHREVAAEAPSPKRLYALCGVLAIVLLLVGAAVTKNIFDSKRAQIAGIKRDTVGVDEQFKQLEQDKKDLLAMREWEEGDVSWLDEFYDLAARFPQRIGLHLTRVQLERIPRRDKEKYVARMTINGVAPEGKDHLVHDFMASLHDSHLQARLDRIKAGANNHEFVIRIDIAKQPAQDYVARLIPLRPQSRVQLLPDDRPPDLRPPAQRLLEPSEAATEVARVSASSVKGGSR